MSINNIWNLIVDSLALEIALYALGVILICIAIICLVHSLIQPETKYNYETCTIEKVEVTNTTRKKIIGIIFLTLALLLIGVAVVTAAKRIDIKWQYAKENDYMFYIYGIRQQLNLSEVDQYNNGQYRLEFDDENKRVIIHTTHPQDEALDAIFDLVD